PRGARPPPRPALEGEPWVRLVVPVGPGPPDAGCECTAAVSSSVSVATAAGSSPASGARATLPRSTAPDAAGSVTVWTLAPARLIIGVGRGVVPGGASRGGGKHLPPPEGAPDRIGPAQ